MIMFKELRIQNFKGLKDTGVIRMAPITLLFGANNSGKSSIGQFLMMLKQTVESQDRDVVFNLGNENSAVRFGSYRDMVFQRDTQNTQKTQKIDFGYRWSLPETLKFKDPVSDKLFSGDELVFQATVGLDDKNRRTPVLDYLLYELYADTEPVLSLGMEREERSNTKFGYTVEADGYELKRKPGRARPLDGPVHFYGFPDEAVAYYRNADFTHELNLCQEKLFRSLYYLGPFRTKAERLYVWTGNSPESVGYAGEDTVAAILAARNRRICAGHRQPSKSFEEIIALELKKMGLIEEFEINPISERRQEYKLKVHTKGTQDRVSLADAGFGITQALPVLTQCFYAPAGSVILMKHPESGLHPSAQSALADVMIDVINSRENGADRNIQLIIETHSEYFLRRLQRRIAENFKSVLQDKVAAYFADITKTPAVLEALEIDADGNIHNWPGNFFGDEMGDFIKQSKAATKKTDAENRKAKGIPMSLRSP